MISLSLLGARAPAFPPQFQRFDEWKFHDAPVQCGRDLSSFPEPGLQLVKPWRCEFT